MTVLERPRAEPQAAGPDEPFRFKWSGVEVAYDPRANTVTAPLSAADPALQSWLATIFPQAERN